jgi:hypothetical protein
MDRDRRLGKRTWSEALWIFKFHYFNCGMLAKKTGIHFFASPSVGGDIQLIGIDEFRGNDGRQSQCRMGM